MLRIIVCLENVFSLITVEIYNLKNQWLINYAIKRLFIYITSLAQVTVSQLVVNNNINNFYINLIILHIALQFNIIPVFRRVAPVPLQFQRTIPVFVP